MSPKFVRPCVPALAKTIPSGDAWLHEPKLDGYRVQNTKDGRVVRLYSRNGYDWSRRLPRLVESLQALPCRVAVLDGELCVPDQKGRPDFGGMQGAMKQGGDELAVFVFDLLHRDGADLARLPLIERQAPVSASRQPS